MCVWFVASKQPKPLNIKILDHFSVLDKYATRPWSTPESPPLHPSTSGPSTHKLLFCGYFRRFPEHRTRVLLPLVRLNERDHLKLVERLRKLLHLLLHYEIVVSVIVLCTV